MADQETWKQFVAFGPGFVTLVLILIFLIRMAPTWKEIKLKELDLRGNEAVIRGEEAKALEALAKVLYEVAVEQRRAADTVKIMQRINSRSADDLAGTVDGLSDRLMILERNADSTTTKQPAAH